MDSIDYVYYTATTTDVLGGVTVTQAQYFIPFLDFFMIFLVLIFTIICVLLVDYFCYPKRYLIKIKNYLKISKRIKNAIWN